MAVASAICRWPEPGDEEHRGADQCHAAQQLQPQPLRPQQQGTAMHRQAGGEDDEDDVAQPGDLDRRQALQPQQLRHRVGEGEQHDGGDDEEDAAQHPLGGCVGMVALKLMSLPARAA